MATIHVDEEALNYLKSTLEGAGQGYKSDLARLENLISEITSGDIKGDPADDLLAKFNAKSETLRAITRTIEEAEEYMGMQTSKFSSLLSDLKSGMH